jgi:hypothetical protein
MSKVLPKVHCGLFIEANFDESDQPGFEMKIDVNYRNLPQLGLVALEKEIAGLIDRMASYGEVDTNISEK